MHRFLNVGYPFRDILIQTGDLINDFPGLVQEGNQAGVGELTADFTLESHTQQSAQLERVVRLSAQEYPRIGAELGRLALAVQCLRSVLPD